MEFQTYDNSVNNFASKPTYSWNTLDMDNDEYFNWTSNEIIKISESPQQHAANMMVVGRKRKLSDEVIVDDSGDDDSLTHDSVIKAPPTKAPAILSKSASEVDGKQRKKDNANGTSRMPQWQVDDIADLNADIEGSLNGLGAEHSHTSFNMNDAILSISGLTVFKQEAPSPTGTGQQEAGGRPQALQLHGGHQQQQQQYPRGGHGAHDSNNNSMNGVTNGLQHLLGNGQNGYGHSNAHSPQNGHGMDGNMLSSSPIHDTYAAITSTNHAEDGGRFQYVLAAATSIATKVNEDTLTYLNQGQSYEIKLRRLGDVGQYRGKTLQSIIRICFHERRLQYMEKEQMANWQRARPGDRILEMDVPLSYGVADVVQPTTALNIIQFNWDPTKEVGAYIKVNCISTEFTPKKHGGEKGVPFRIQVVTYDAAAAVHQQRPLHAAACQIKVFKLKGADRKHKQDRDKVLKRPASEQEKYQPSYECTVLNDIPNDAVVSCTPPGPLSPENSQNGSQPVVNTQIVPKLNRSVAYTPQAKPQELTVSNQTIVIEKPMRSEASMSYDEIQLSASANPQQAAKWLVNNRFEKYLSSFTNFSGADMLRMSRDDFMEVCGQADGIRLYNALHLKTIAPKLTLYVSRSRASPYHAIYLNEFSISELQTKLATVLTITPEAVREVYLQGPQGIHVHLEDAVLRHIRDETMFNVILLPERNGGYAFLLKPDISGQNSKGSFEERYEK